MFLPIFAKAQLDANAALDFQNTLRSYYYYDNLMLDNELSNLANQWANELLINNMFELQNDSYAENIYLIANDSQIPSSYNPYVDACVGWVIDSSTNMTLDNMLQYDYVGFGSARSVDKIIVVAKFK